MKPRARNPEPETRNILFAGVGGQGVLTASEVCARAALLAGRHVRKAEVKGMSQRGGSVESHVRYGPAAHAPLIAAGRADFLVSLDAAEGQRLLAFLKPGGIDLVHHLDRARRQVADRRHVNTYLLGVLSRHLDLPAAAWAAALAEQFPGAIAANRAAFRQGAASVKHP